MKRSNLFLLLSLMLFLSYCNNKNFVIKEGQGLIPIPIIGEQFDSLETWKGIYTLRLCKTATEIDGVEIFLYKPCFEKDTINSWNHLTYFIFKDNNRVEYHSLKPKFTKSQPNGREQRPELSGLYHTERVVQDGSPPGEKIIMELHKKRGTQKKLRSRVPDIVCEFFMNSNTNVLSLKKIKSPRMPFRKVYNIGEIFPKDSTFIYCFERFDSLVGTN